MSEQPEKKPWSRRRKAGVFVGLFFLALIAIVLAFIKVLSSPAQGTIKNPPTPTKSSAQQQNGSKVYSGKYISFVYPADFEIVQSEQNSNYLDVVNLFSTDHTDTQLAVSVVREALTNDAGFNLRQSHPQTYKKILSSPNDVVFTSSTNGSEETEYIAHSGMVATISMTVPGSKDISKEFVVVSNSLQWNR